LLERELPRAVPIAITGLSAWTPYGRGTEALLQALRDGRSDAAIVSGMHVSIDDPWYYARYARQVLPEPTIRTTDSNQVREVSIQDWPCEMAVESAWDAVIDADYPQRRYAARRIAVCNGTSHGSNHGLLEYLQQSLTRHPDPLLIADSAAIVARRIAQRVGALGSNLTFNTACSSGLNALGQGLRLLRNGRADCVIAGAQDTFSALSLVGFSSLKALDSSPCRPFDLQRAGLTLADAAAYTVLERLPDALARGRQPLALLTGYGYIGEAHHATAPDPAGDGVFRGMLAALADEGGEASADLDFVAAHGTGTPANDEAELKAVERCVAQLGLERAVDVVSFKSQLGHALGAAGSSQVVATVLAMRAGIVPGNIGLLQPLPHSERLNLPSAPRAAEISMAICNGLGFGGSMAAVCLRKHPR
jgi:3-oxoacyl-[acyl-carrier-protein] synthase II